MLPTDGYNFTDAQHCVCLQTSILTGQLTASGFSLRPALNSEVTTIEWQICT